MFELSELYIMCFSSLSILQHYHTSINKKYLKTSAIIILKFQILNFIFKIIIFLNSYL